jgi:hypothetical protein
VQKLDTPAVICMNLKQERGQGKGLVAVLAVGKIVHHNLMIITQMASPWTNMVIGPFVGVLGAFLLNYVWQSWRDNRQQFVGEYHIKGELEEIKHDLEVGGKPEPIEPVYGADYVREYHLFGEKCTQVIYWYKGFEKYNSGFEARDYYEKLRRQHSMANQIGGILSNPWLKKIPDEDSDLSIIKFIRYLFGLDAMKETIKISWWQFWKIMTFSEMLKFARIKR